MYYRCSAMLPVWYLHLILWCEHWAVTQCIDKASGYLKPVFIWGCMGWTSVTSTANLQTGWSFKLWVTISMILPNRMVCIREDPPTKSISPVGVHLPNSPLPPRGGWTCTKISNITVKTTVSNQEQYVQNAARWCPVISKSMHFLAATLDQQDHSLRSKTNPQALVLEEPSLQCLWGQGVYKEVYCGIEYCSA